MGMIRKVLYKWLIQKFFKEGSILDVGAGDCEFLDVCKGLSRDVVGIDIAPLRSDVVKWDLTKGDFVKKHGRVDNLFCSQIIEHFNNDELIKFIDKVCKKRVIIITPIETKRFWFRKGIAQYCHKRPYTLMELDYKMLGIGFKPIFKLKGLPVNHFSLDNIIWVGEK